MLRSLPKVLAVIAVIASGFLYFRSDEIRHPPGVLVHRNPLQRSIPPKPLGNRDGYTLEAVAEYEITARVLATKRYRRGAASDLMPIDVAVGWGPMSNQAVLDQLDISQARRFFFYSWDTPQPPVPRAEIERHAANIHIIAGSENVAANVSRLRVGELVTMKGLLVNAAGAEGEMWRTSLNRTDTGRGACEVFLVHECEPAAGTEDSRTSLATGRGN